MNHVNIGNIPICEPIYENWGKIGEKLAVTIIEAHKQNYSLSSILKYRQNYLR
jgi:hypothetical protein